MPACEVRKDGKFIKTGEEKKGARLREIDIPHAWRWIRGGGCCGDRQKQPHQIFDRRETYLAWPQFSRRAELFIDKNEPSSRSRIRVDIRIEEP